MRVYADGDRLRVSAPRGVLVPELAEEVAARKSELLALLGRVTGPIERAPAGISVPLTAGQERLWALMEMQQDTDAYHVPMVYRIQGALDVPALERSLDQIQRRHEVLRTRFHTQAGRPTQYVTDAVPFALEIADGSHLGGTERAAWADEKLAEGIHEPFELEKGPLWRCTLLRLAADEHVLVFTAHHITFDRFSKRVFLGELEAFYAGKSAPDLAIQYRDFAYWQQSDAQRQLAEDQLAFWKDQLRDGTTELLLPTDHGRSASGAGEGRSQSFVIPEAVAEKLAALGRDTKSSSYMILLAGFYALLYRYSGQTDQTICAPVACRDSTDVEALIGYFNNIVPMRTDLSGDPTFRELTVRVRQVVMGAIGHQDAPFHRIAQIPEAANAPLTRAMFNYRDEGSSRLRLPGLTSTPVEYRRQQADFDLALYVGVESDGLAGVLDYNAELFEQGTIRLLLRNYLALLELVVIDPDRRLSTLPCFRQRFSEVEDALVRHPKVDEAIVVVRSDSVGASNLAAYLVLDEDDVPTRSELHSFLSDELPARQGHLALVPVDELPRLAGLDIVGIMLDVAMERELAAIWRRVLWRTERIGIHDDFFDLGGHSLLSVQLLAETESYLGRRVRWAKLGQLSTIAKFAEFVEQAEDETAISTPGSGLGAEIMTRLRSHTAAWVGRRASADSLITGLNTGGSRQPVFWVVQRYLNLARLAEHLGADQPIYGMRSGHRIMDRTPANVRALAECYVDHVLEIQGGGPLIVGGICQGAEIAFQMALRLNDLGHELNLLGLQERFIPHDYPGRVAFFFGDASDRSPYYHFARPELGWRKYYTGGFEAHIIRGAHGTYFQEAHVPYLAKEMQRAFDSAQNPRVDRVEPEPALQVLRPSAYKAELRLAEPVAVAGSEARVLVTVRNASPDSWLASHRSGVFLGARWLKPKKYGSHRYCSYARANVVRTPLPADLGPGGTLELELTVPLPYDPRLKTLEIDLVEEGVTWFSDAGSESALIRIRPS